MPVDVATEVDACDDFLAGVAALGIRDCVEVVEVGLLRDGRLVDIKAPLGVAGLDARDGVRVLAADDCSRHRVEDALPRRLMLGDGPDDEESVDTEGRDASDDARCVIDVNRGVAVGRERGERGWRGAERFGDGVACTRAVHAKGMQTFAFVAIGRGARVDELPDQRSPAFSRASGHVDDQRDALEPIGVYGASAHGWAARVAREDAHVGHDAPLRRERGSIAAESGCQSGNVVGDEAGDRFRRLRAPECPEVTCAVIDEERAAPKRGVLLADIGVVVGSDDTERRSARSEAARGRDGNHGGLGRVAHERRGGGSRTRGDRPGSVSMALRRAGVSSAINTSDPTRTACAPASRAAAAA